MKGKRRLPTAEEFYKVHYASLIRAITLHGEKTVVTLLADVIPQISMTGLHALTKVIEACVKVEMRKHGIPQAPARTEAATKKAKKDPLAKWLPPNQIVPRR